MQPYLFPYIGYFQLINAVDIFVVYDDVNFIKRGYINRNSILIGNSKFQFVLPVKGSSQNNKIHELEFEGTSNKLQKTIVLSYSKAPHFHEVLPLLQKIFNFQDKNISRFLTHSISEICSYLGIKTKIVVSSKLKIAQDQKASERIISICKSVGASYYINSIGGKLLYDATDFNKNNLNLQFLEAEKTEYSQFGDPFVPWLSIIDVLMFNDVPTIQKMLSNYTIN